MNRRDFASTTYSAARLRWEQMSRTSSLPMLPLSERARVMFARGPMCAQSDGDDSPMKPLRDARRALRSLTDAIELARDDAVGLAYKERTGLELGDGEPYTPADAERADEIILMFPKAGA